MADDKKDPWLNHLALTTVIFAVCATLSTFKGGGYSSKSIMSQAQASDQWAYYQAKNIRANMYLEQKENLALELSVSPNANNPEVVKKYEAAITAAEEKVKKYENDKAEIQANAKNLEVVRDDAQKHGKPFGIAVIFFQVAILLSSVSGLFKRRELWYVALPLGVIGVAYFIDGFWLFW